MFNFFSPGPEARSEAERSLRPPGTQTKRTKRSGVSTLGLSLRVIQVMWTVVSLRTMTKVMTLVTLTTAFNKLHNSRTSISLG